MCMPTNLQRVNVLFNQQSLRFFSLSFRSLCNKTDVNDIRNISRLTPKQQDILHQRYTDDNSQFDDELVIKSKRKIWARIGSRCKINPAITWPSKFQLHKQIKYEAEWVPRLEDMLSELKLEKQRQKQELEERQKNIAKCMNKMPELIKQYEAKQKVIQDAASEREVKRQLLLEEARDFFGYEVDPRDEKFQEMVTKKEQAEKMAEKQRKREQKLAKMMAKYQSVVTQKPKELSNTNDLASNDEIEKST